MSAVVERTDVWADVVGQDAAVAALQAAAQRPVHAYLFLGPAGSGRLAAARAFAALLLGVDAEARGADVGRAVRLGVAGRHPDVHEFVPQGAFLRVEDAEEITRAASRSPVEGGRKVLILTEFHKIQRAGPALLKTIEEPSASTTFVILAEEIPPELVPIASRAVQIPFGPVPALAVVDRLVAEGVDETAAIHAAEAAAGDLARARLLATDPELAARRATWAGIPGRLDGTGHVVSTIVSELIAHIDAAQAPLDARHAAERETWEAEMEAIGGATKGGTKARADAEKREIRRHRADELRFGLGVLAGELRDRAAALAAEGRDPSAAIAATKVVTECADALIRNPNETLLLQQLLVRIGPR